MTDVKMNMKSIKEVLKSKTVNSNTVNSNTVNSSVNTFNNTVNSATTPKTPPTADQIHYVAQILCEGLSDFVSKAYYIKLATVHPHNKLLEALSITKDAYIRGAIRSKRAIYFQGILKQWGLVTNFRISNNYFA